MTTEVAPRDTGAPTSPQPSRPVWRIEARAILLAAVALLVQVVGYAMGWADHEQAALVLWYVGFVGIVAPFAWLLLAPSRTGHQRLAAALGFGLMTYLSWYLSDPVLSTRFDETQHVTTLVDMIDRHQFFYPNTTLPVSPHYPGLELATAGVHWVTGLPLIASSVVVVLAARSIFITAFFLLTSRIGRSTRVGATVVLLYGASPQSYFFNSQFAYQTVAIAMVAAALYLLIRAFDSGEERPWRLLIAIQACLAALAVTHHLTSWLTVGLLWGLVLAFRLGGEVRRFRIALVTAELATVFVAAWTALITPLLVSYLKPIFGLAADQLLTILDGAGAREVGVATNGQATPTWELMVMAGSILLWILMLVPAAWAAWRHGTLGATRARYVPLAIAVIYPALQVGRFSVSAAEVADRASTFVTMAMALVVGAWLAPRLQQFSKLVVPGLVIMVLGGAILGSGPDWERVTGPYLAGAEQRSVDGDTVAVAQWAGTYLPEGANVAADATLTRVLPNYSSVIPVTQTGGLDSMTPLFIASTVDINGLRLIFDNDVDFVFVDTRLRGQTARSGAFFEGGTGYGPQAATVTDAEVDKFQGVPGFRLILDGPVRVYDVRGLRGVPDTFPPPRAPPGIPGSWTGWQVGLTGVLLLVILALRGGLFDPRRFRARDLSRVAVVVPAMILLGVVGVLARFSPAAGAVAAVVLCSILIATTRRPPPLRAGAARSRDGWLWTAATAVVILGALSLATWSSWHALLDHPALAAPSSASSSASSSGSTSGSTSGGAQ